MPELTKNLERVSVWRYNENRSNYDFSSDIKLILQVAELRMKYDYCVKEFIVIDMLNFKLSDIKKVSLPLMKKLEVCLL
ncbi:hypothetical protein L9F63_027458, partial [Diploptera punctata]